MPDLLDGEHSSDEVGLADPAVERRRAKADSSSVSSFVYDIVSASGVC